MYGDGSRIQRQVRARQQDLTTECDGLLMQDELKLASKLLDIASRTGLGIHTNGLLVFSQVTRSISTVGAARNLRSCSCNC